jgi:hypothetical protein
VQIFSMAGAPRELVPTPGHDRSFGTRAGQNAPDLLVLVRAEQRAQARGRSRTARETAPHDCAEEAASVAVWHAACFTKTVDAPQWQGTLDVSAMRGSA